MTEDDSRLGHLRGGYRLPFDPRPAIRPLGIDPADRAAWDALWEQLHHQGDVDEASDAAVVLLGQSARGWANRTWELYALVATIEVERHAVHNPDVPDWLAEHYHEALEALRTLALGDLGGAADRLLLRSALSLIAVTGGDHALGTMLAGLDDSEIDEYNEKRVAYWERYRIRD